MSSIIIRRSRLIDEVQNDKTSHVCLGIGHGWDVFFSHWVRADRAWDLQKTIWEIVKTNSQIVSFISQIVFRIWEGMCTTQVIVPHE